MLSEEKLDSEQDIAHPPPEQKVFFGFAPSTVEYFDTREAALADDWSDRLSLASIISAFIFAIPYIAMFANMAVFVYWFVAAFMPMAMNQWGAEHFSLGENLSYGLLALPILGASFLMCTLENFYKRSLLLTGVAFLIADSF